MTKKLLFLLVMFGTFTTFAQKKPVVVAKPKPITVVSNQSTTVLKTNLDSVNYLMGAALFNYYSQQGVTKFDTKMIAQSINDRQSGKPPLINDSISSLVMTNFFTKLQHEKALTEIEKGKKFLEENKKNPKIKTTASGLQYEVLQEGTGEKPAATDTVTVNYLGKLLDGKEFDNSYKRGQPATFPLNHVIPGWTEGVQLMSIGSKYRFYIPYNLGYGERGAGSSIPGGALLIFDVDLLSVTKAAK